MLNTTLLERIKDLGGRDWGPTLFPERVDSQLCTCGAEQ